LLYALQLFGADTVMWYQLAMIIASHRYYFWFYGYPKPAAEHGARS
jgi:hypothetical protein